MLGRRRPAPQWDEATLDAAALRYLGHYASSAENLRRVLLRKTDDRDLVDRIVAACRRRGFLDDAAYAAGRTASLRRGGASRRAIEVRLRQKGVDGETIRDALAQGSDEVEAAVALARRRRLGPWRRAEQRDAFHDKDLAVFARAGFALDVARRVLACRTAEEAETLTPT